MLGVIAEDDTDCETLEVLAKRIVHEKLRVKPRRGKGCSQVKAKAARWVHDLAKAGCSFVIIVQDRDRSDENSIRKHYEAAPLPSGVERLVCVPVEELEAWFWSDQKLLAAVGGRTVKAHDNPHLLSSPKEKLASLSRRGGVKPTYSTNDNPRLAKTLALDLCAKRCPAFHEFREFLLTKVKPAFDRAAKTQKKRR